MARVRIEHIESSDIRALETSTLPRILGGWVGGLSPVAGPSPVWVHENGQVVLKIYNPATGKYE